MVGFANATWTRKPNSFEEIRGKVRKDDVPEILPIMYPFELWVSWECPSFDLMTPFDTNNVPQYFRLKVDRRWYLVNTEGYDYCRYVAKVEED